MKIRWTSLGKKKSEKYDQRGSFVHHLKLALEKKPGRRNGKNPKGGVPYKALAKASRKKMRRV